MGYYGLNLTQMLVLHTAFEALENTETGMAFLREMGWQRYKGDTLANMIGDTIGATAGWAAAIQLKKKA